MTEITTWLERSGDEARLIADIEMKLRGPLSQASEGTRHAAAVVSAAIWAPVLDPALAALREVIDLHQPTSTVGIQCDEHNCTGTDDEPCSEAGPYGEHEMPSCGACSAPTEDGLVGEFVYPCPTVRRVTAALGVAREQKESVHG